MDIDNITSIKSLIINRKIVHTPIKSFFFFMLLAERFPEINFVSRSVFGELQLMKISLSFKTSCCNLKIRVLGETVCDFCITLILKGVMTFRSQRVQALC